MSDLSKQVSVLKEIEKARSAIKQKYDSVKANKINSDDFIQEYYKPIIQPLNKLVEVSEKNKKAAEPEKYSKKIQDESILDDDLNESFESAILDDSDRPDTSMLDISLKNNADLYLKMLQDGNTSTLDTITGVRLLNSGLKIGNSNVNFDGHDIIIDNKSYDKTPGLVELLFKKSPIESTITHEDLRNYSEIVEKTKAHRKHYKLSAPIRDKNNQKYKKFVKLDSPEHKNILKDISPTDKGSKTPIEGSGFSLPKYKVMRKISHTDYVYWDDPNELVDRLRLLIAEDESGNHNHINEIQSIVEELKEANIIY